MLCLSSLSGPVFFSLLRLVSLGTFSPSVRLGLNTIRPSQHSLKERLTKWDVWQWRELSGKKGMFHRIQSRWSKNGTSLYSRRREKWKLKGNSFSVWKSQCPSSKSSDTFLVWEAKQLKELCSCKWCHISHRDSWQLYSISQAPSLRVREEKYLRVLSVCVCVQSQKY